VTTGQPHSDLDDLASLRPPPAPRASSWLSILLAGIVALFLLAGLFLLMLQLGGPLAIATAVVLIPIGFVALFHYVVWGWWLSGTIREEVEAEERNAERHETNRPEP
jgi:membrane protein implicated in regulation of membrane protease activity